MKQFLTQYSFVAGELSPRLYGRTDIDQYTQGLAKLHNFLVMPHGGVIKRHGSRFTGSLASLQDKVRLLRFQFTITQTYLIVLTNNQATFWTNGAPVMVGGAPYNISTPYYASELDSIDYAQSGDEIIIACPGHPVQSLKRIDGTTWTLTQFTTSKGPFKNINDTTTTFNAAVLGAHPAYTLTVSPTADASKMTVGKRFKIRHRTSSKWYVFEITGSVTAGSAPAKMINDIDAVITGFTATEDWYEESWHETDEYPRTVCFFEQRLIFGGSASEPQKVWCSATSDYMDFDSNNEDGTVSADNGLNFRIATTDFDPIQWLSPGQELFIGTGSSEFSLSSGSNSALSPTNILVRRHSSYGSKMIKPEMVGSSMFYVQRSGDKLLEWAYDYTIDGYRSANAGLLAEHIAKQGIKQIVYQKSPDPILWCLLNDGSLIGMTYLFEQNVIAWHRHNVDGGASNRKLQAICVLPSESGDYEQLYLAVAERQTSYYTIKVEHMTNYSYVADNVQSCYFDSWVRRITPGTSILIPEFNNGVSVGVIGDGEYLGQFTVTSGAITLSKAYDRVLYGLSYTSSMKTLPLDFPSDFGSGVGQQKRMAVSFLRFYETLGGDISVMDTDNGGIVSNNIEVLPFRTIWDNNDQIPALFTGLYKVNVPMPFGRDVQIELNHAYPYPCTVLSLTLQGTGQ